MINGFIKNAKLNFFEKHLIKNLNLTFNIKDKEYYLQDINGSVNQIKLLSSLIKIKKKNNQFLIKGNLISEKNNFDLKKLNNILGSDFKDYNIKNISLSSNNNFTFNLNKKFKISNFDLKSTLDLKRLTYNGKLSRIKKYLPNLKELIILEDHIISVNYQKNKLDFSGKGKIIINDKIDNLNYRISKTNNGLTFDTNINIKKNAISIDMLEYKKKIDVDSVLKISGAYKKDEKIKLKLISYNENKNQFLIENLSLNKKFNILDVKKVKLNYLNNNKIKNQINLIKNKKKYDIFGKSFDVSKIIDLILNDNDTKNESSSIFNNLNSNIDIKINKMYIDKNTFVNNLTGNIYFKKNKLNKLNLESYFPNNKKINLIINTNKNNEKIVALFSDYPKPLVKQYKFIKGFEGGVLDFYSVKKDNSSNSVLKISNFKLQEVPVLAKLLTLASLQGIADLLTGEGIRFTDFEMKYSNQKGLMKIEEMYAIGPAISIMMDGYIENKKLVSLRGTLVPATTINRVIASIPLIGNILVGKKTGEGIFGVSFKVKGPPQDLKTTVNPIKTLTPRFITRTLEKIKKN